MATINTTRYPEMNLIPQPLSQHSIAHGIITWHVNICFLHTGTCVVADKTSVVYDSVLNTMARECMGQHHGPEICGLLPAFHIITGNAYTQPVLEDQCSRSSSKIPMESHHDTPPVSQA